MTDTTTQRALDVLIEIAENDKVEPDTRIRAAATIITDAKTPSWEGVPA